MSGNSAWVLRKHWSPPRGSRFQLDLSNLFKPSFVITERIPQHAGD